MESTKMEEFQVLEDHFNDALITNRTTVIGKYLSDEWFLVEPSFGIIPRDRFLKSIDGGYLSHTAMKKKVQQVKIHDTIAIVTSKGKNTGKYREEDFDIEIWVTNTYKRNNADWICIMTQESPIPC